MLAPALPQQLSARAARPLRRQQHSRGSAAVLAASGRLQGVSKGVQAGPVSAAIAAAAAASVLLSGTGESLSAALCIPLAPALMCTDACSLVTSYVRHGGILPSNMSICTR